MICIKDYTDKIDKALFDGLSFDNVFSYGIVTRHRDMNGKVINIADSELLLDDGELSYWDDRYNIVWFHRLQSSSLDTSVLGYGRVKNRLKETLSFQLVVWAKRRYTWRGEYFEMKQPVLYREIAKILNYRTDATLNGADFDNAVIENSEFTAGSTSKESILLRFNYDLVNEIADDCLPCLDKAEECFEFKNQ